MADILFVGVNEKKSQPGVTVMPDGITSKEELLKAVAKVLKFPDYFGQNFDALDEMLRDLDWLPPGLVTLAHADLPAIPEDDLRTYIRILKDAMGEWEKSGSQRFVVNFPTSVESRVKELSS